MVNTSKRNWADSVKAFCHPRVVAMLFFGFSAGVPILLIFSSLSIWLREAGIERSAVTFFSWAALGYSFKFVWAPLVDILPLPFLTKWIGRRKAWILLSQAVIISAIIWMGSINPLAGEVKLTIMAFAAVLLGFSSATQDIVIDAYRIESAGSELQAMMASSYIAGYRIGMLAAGAGALFLAQLLGSVKGAYYYPAWRHTYFIMAGVMLIGVATTLIVKEPDVVFKEENDFKLSDYLGLVILFLLAVTGFIMTFYFSSDIALSLKKSLNNLLCNHILSGFIIEVVRLVSGIAVAVVISRGIVATRWVNSLMIEETYINPIKDFFSRYGFKIAWLLLSIVGLYRISDIVLGIISNVFYQDLGFSKFEIASVVKTFGVFMTIFGGFIGGLLSLRYGILKILFTGALLSSVTNLLFMILAYTGKNILMLYVVISADNLAAGLASAAFVAFLSSLTNIRFTAIQYAVFSSLMTLIPKVFGGYSGTIVDSLGYQAFFLISAIAGIPVLFLVYIGGKALELEE